MAHVVGSAVVRDIQALVEDQLRAAAAAALGSEYAEADPLVRPANPQFGHYQSNLALPLAKRLRRKPREIAEAIARALGAPSELFESASVAGPGFINLRLQDGALCAATLRMLGDARLGIAAPESPQRVVVDYASPNLAKEMHIGHLRSTIIGDCIVRVLAFAGHDVIRQNHIGDWGTQFGMLLEHLLDSGWDRSADHSVSDLNALYQEAKSRFDTDAGFADRARRRVVTLQAGDEQSLSYWRQLIDESCAHMKEVFRTLGVLMTDEDLRGESYFNSRLERVVDDLTQAGVLEESDGAQVAFCEGFTNKEGNPLPLIVRKSDGGFGYAATDLAAARFRIDELGADRIIYVVGAPQSDHFAMLFATLTRAGWARQARLQHVAFGAILGRDRKPFKTRAGTNVKLMEVLGEAVQRARATLEEKDRGLEAAELASIARAVGIGAVKYADLCSDRIKDYTFDYERMLSMEGNTAPYLQYAYVRIQSILRKASQGASGEATSAGPLSITHEAERALMLDLLRLPRVVEQVVETLEPHRLCTYLYELAGRVHQFHERCPVLKAKDSATRQSRLSLSRVAGDTLARGLDLLGVAVVPRM